MAFSRRVATSAPDTISSGPDRAYSSRHVRLAEGLIVERLGSGARLTITYTRDPAGAMIAQRIKRSDLPRLSDRT